MATGKGKLARQYAQALQKKSREWGVSGHLEAAIWARKRAEGLQKGNHKEKQQLQDITGTWDFPSGTVQLRIRRIPNGGGKHDVRVSEILK